MSLSREGQLALVQASLDLPESNARLKRAVDGYRRRTGSQLG